VPLHRLPARHPLPDVLAIEEQLTASGLRRTNRYRATARLVEEEHVIESSLRWLHGAG